MKFELFVALRYLRAKRKQAAISIITIISILGVTAGVTALIVALAISRGFRDDLQSKLLRGTSHINVLPVDVNEGIANYPALVSKIKTVKGIRSATPAIYSAVLISAARPDGIMLKGMAVDDPEFLAQGFFDVLQGSALELARLPTTLFAIASRWERKSQSGLELSSAILSPSSQTKAHSPQ